SMGVAGPKDALMARGELDQHASHLEGSGVQQQQPVFQVEPEIARDLVVARASRVESLPDPRQSLRQPRLDRCVDVFVSGTGTQLPGLHGPERSSKPAPEASVVRLADQFPSPEGLDMAQAAEHVPSKEPSVPGPILFGGELPRQMVEADRRAPERGRTTCGHLVPAQEVADKATVELPGGRDLREI